MNRYILLTKILLKNSDYSSGDKKKRIKSIALGIFIILCFIPTIWLVIEFISNIYEGLVVINQQGLILGLGIGIVSIIIFLFGIFYTINIFYFSKDIDILLPMPLKPSEIIGAKFTISLLYEYLTETILLMPFLITYGIKSSQGIVYYVYSIILFILVPVIPLSLALILNIFIMSFTNIGKHKDLFKILGGIFGIAAALLVNTWIQGMQKNSMSNQDMINMITSGNNSLIGLTSKIFPDSAIAAKSLIFNNSLIGFKYLILFLFLNLISIIILLIIGEKLYFKGAVGGSESSSERKEINLSENSRLFAKNFPLKSITIKELKILFRTPSYFLNCVLMNFIWPVFILIPAFTQKDFMKVLREFSKLINEPKIIGMILGFSMVIGIFVASTNMITCTAISREGHNIYILKYLPVSYKVQIMGKVLSGIILSIVSMLVVIVVAMILIKLPIYLAVISLFISTLGIVFSCILGIIVDVNFPKLNWDNEAKAVKQNFNAFISMIIGVAFAGILMFLIIKFNEKILVIDSILVLVLLAIDCLMYLLCIKVSSNALKNIEV
ncbi:transporter [Clostridium sp. JN-1]|uniref:putative ABC transporter permease subunit n=1 Tax=Clostridium sp. JN-1 TaxID=2483110 RepID=UPI000F0B7D9E|nr:transporter [Clostridium sp. JN-1]